MFCKNCGTELFENQTVCPLCGSQDIAKDPFGKTVTLQDPPDLVISVPDEKKGKSNKEVIAVIIALAVVLAVIVTALVMRLLPRDKDDSGAQTAATQQVQTTQGATDAYGDFEGYEPQGNTYYVKDSAELLTKRQRKTLSDKLEDISEKYKFDVIAKTTKTFNNKTPQEYSDGYYDSNGYGQNSSRDGCILVINSVDNEWYLSTCGRGMKVLDDDGISAVSDAILPSLKKAEFYEAFIDYADVVAERLAKEQASQSTAANSAKTTTATAANSAHKPFYAIFVSAKKDSAGAYEEAERMRKLGYSGAEVLVTTDWSNLNKERWYVVTTGEYATQEEAEKVLERVQIEVPPAYVKYTGEWQGN